MRSLRFHEILLWGEFSAAAFPKAVSGQMLAEMGRSNTSYASAANLNK
jgi:hypothetical protein